MKFAKCCWLLIVLAAMPVLGVEIIAHRGASHDAPENTLASYRLGWQQGADTNELDIHQSRDGQLVCIHDKNTKRTTGVDREILSQTLSELRQQDAGSWKGAAWMSEKIPTLAEALETMPDGKRTFIEIKCGAEILPELKRVLDRSGKQPQQLVIIGFDFETMVRTKQELLDLQVYWIVDYKKAKGNGALPSLGDLAKKAAAAGLDGLDVSWKFPIDADAVAEVKQQGLKLFVWTVDDAAVAAKWSAAGVDGITTNRPQWLREQLTKTAAKPRRSNILLIVSDDQGYPDLGCIGTKPIQTPNLDRLAAEGVRATSFYVTWPACTPSRGSLLTGRYPQRNGLYDMVRNDLVNFGHRYSPEEYAVSPEMTLGLDPREITLGDVMRSAGYRTGMVGKWDMGQARRYLPLQRGFDFFYGHGNNGIDYYTHERYGVHSMFSGNTRTEADRGVYATDLFRREALKFIQQASDQPWFLYLAFNAPHGASSFVDADSADSGQRTKGVQAPEEDVAPYRSRGIKDSLAHYYGAVTHMDTAIGEILSHLRETKQLQNTLVMFFTDNGGSGNGGNAPLRGKKSTMWEGGLRVPFIATWPGQLPAGKVNDEFLTSLEVLPTLVSVAGGSAPADVKLDGFNMLPVLRGEHPSPRNEMFWQRRADKAVRVGNYKWVESQAGGGLFDLSSDLAEAHDLSARQPEVLARVKARFTAWRAEMDAAAPRGPFRDY